MFVREHVRWIIFVFVDFSPHISISVSIANSVVYITLELLGFIYEEKRQKWRFSEIWLLHYERCLFHNWPPLHVCNDVHHFLNIWFSWLQYLGQEFVFDWEGRSEGFLLTYVKKMWHANGMIQTCELTMTCTDTSASIPCAKAHPDLVQWHAGRK